MIPGHSSRSASQHVGEGQSHPFPSSPPQWLCKPGSCTGELFCDPHSQLLKGGMTQEASRALLLSELDGRIAENLVKLSPPGKGSQDLLIC